VLLCGKRGPCEDYENAKRAKPAADKESGLRPIIGVGAPVNGIPPIGDLQPGAAALAASEEAPPMTLSNVPATGRGVCHSIKKLLCFIGRFERGGVGKPIDFERYSPFPVEV